MTNSTTKQRGTALAIALTLGLAGFVDFTPSRAHAYQKQSAVPTSGAWRSFHFNSARTGSNNSETTLSRTNVSTLRRKWSTRLGPLQGGSLDSVASSPAVANGTVYIGSTDKRFDALDAHTGTIKWRVVTGGSISASAAIAGGMVFVCSGDGVLHAFRSTDGTTVWSRRLTPGIVTSPAVVGGIVYQAAGTTLYALNAKTGAVVWSVQAPDSGPFTTPAVNKGLVIIESGVNWCCAFTLHVEAFNATSGSLVWSFATSGTNGETAGIGPLVSGGVVYVGTGPSTQLIAFNAANGAVLWVAPSRDQVSSIPTISGGVLYVEESSTLAWFDAATGQNISFISGSGANGSPAFANNVLYTTEGSLVAAWTPGGFRPLWTAAPGGFGILQSSPAVVDGMLFVGSNSNTVVAYGLP